MAEGDTIGIIGAGAVGCAIAGRMAGVRPVLLADRHPDRAKSAVTGIGGGVIPASMDEALATDIVVLALPLPGRIGFAREHALRLMGKWVVAVDNAPELLADQLPLSRVVSVEALFAGRLPGARP
jgi:predicted dinucleotide-binding enzyme